MKIGDPPGDLATYTVTTVTPLPSPEACASVADLLARAVAPFFDEGAALELVELMFGPSGFRSEAGVA